MRNANNKGDHKDRPYKILRASNCPNGAIYISPG